MKKYVPFMSFVFPLFPLQPFESFHRENKFRKVLSKDPVTEISSTEFAVFRPARPKHSPPRRFLPLGNRTFQPE